ncbi:protein cordon-bleu isoform X3 [Ixodes scapularis]|uniref:protein cordon-bleu isoform X3 n=1 Tax=Ixodes scapularis TaxID=6945 RepID=UPI001C38F7E1|nr:protein cordon-bleu isoform X3 [Ixodes scapularis]
MAAASSASTATPAAMSEAAVPHKPDRSRMKKSAAPAPPRSVAGGSGSACSFSGPTTSRSSACVQQPLPPATGSAINRSVSNDDCAIDDLLEGRMDLRLVLPDGREVLVNVERRTPVMDLLVQVATAHKINPSGHLIQVPAGERGDPLTCKPNTAIGSLDTGRLLVVPKAAPGVAVTDAPLLRHVSQHAGNRISKLQPFESTLRVQVRLPRNQLMVVRLPLSTTLEEVRRTACLEKNLDPAGYQLVRPGIPTQPLDLHCSLLEYGASEVMLLSNRMLAENIQNSTADLRSYSMNQEGKRLVLGLPSHSRSKGQSLTGSSSDGTTSSRGASPCRSEPPTTITSRVVPVKKRPAPPPPLPASPPPSTQPRSAGVLLVSEGTPLVATGKGGGKREGGPTHSRQSSDSSGYHEASVLSDLPDTPSPEAAIGRPPSNDGTLNSSAVVARRKSPPRSLVLSSSTSNVAATGPSGRTTRARSINLEGAPIGPGRKRKAPPPPPLTLASGAESKKDGLQAEDPGLREGTASERIKDAAASPERREKGETMYSWDSVVPPPPHFSGAVALSSSTDTTSTNRTSSPEPGPLTPSSWLHRQDDKADVYVPPSHISTLSSAAEDAYSTGVSESLSWEYAIPEPPSPFRTHVPCELDDRRIKEGGKDAVTDGPVSPLQAVAKDTLSSDDLEDDGSLVDSGLVENFHEDLNEPEADSQGAVSCLQDKPSLTSSPVHTAGTMVELVPSVAEQVSTEEIVVSANSDDRSAIESVEHVQDVAHIDHVDSAKHSSTPPVVTSRTIVTTQQSPDDSAREHDTKTTVTQAGERQEIKREVPEATAEQNLEKTADVTVTIKTVVPEEADAKAKMSPVVLDSVQAQTVTISSRSTSEIAVPRQKSSLKEEEPSPAIDTMPLTASVIRKDLVKLSSFPSATETKIEHLEHVPAVSTTSVRSESRSEASIIESEARESGKRGNEPVVRSRSINYGPVAFSIGSYGSYKTEAVEDIFGGDPAKERVERFKNIKVAGSAKASTVMAADVHTSVASKTVAAPIAATVTKVSANNGSANKDAGAGFTVKIGEKKSFGNSEVADQTRKQSMSVIDLRQPQTAVPAETSREAVDAQFVEEKENLLSEYAKLQQQFVAWQQQLASNQNLLEDKKIVPSVATATAATSASQKTPTVSDKKTVNGPHDVRTFTLPRTKPVRPHTHVVQEDGRTFSRQISVNTPVVSFGSWGERREDQQQPGAAPSNNSGKPLNVWKNSSASTAQSGSTSLHPLPARQDSNDGKSRTAKKPAGILYAAPVVRGFSQEAIEKLSQEVCSVERPEPRQAAAPRRNSESGNQVTATKRSSSQENLAAPTIPPKSVARPLSVHVTSLRDLEHTTSTLERISAWDRRSSQSDAVVKLAKKPSGTSSSTSSLPSPDSLGNNKPSVVQATLKSGVVTTTAAVAPLAPPLPFPSAKLNGHAQTNSYEVDGHPKSVSRNFKGREPKVQAEKVTHVTVKPAVAPKVHAAPRKAQVATVDPRDVLMDEIRNFGGKRALKKVSTEPAWQLNICNLRSA